MNEDEIISWLKANSEAMPALDGGTAYRSAVRLRDGTYLGGVVFAPSEPYVQLAMRRFDESRRSGITDPTSIKPGHYPAIVEVFACSGNRVNSYDIASLERSPYAIPLARLREVKGETSMGWTAFAAVMDDGKEFSFGTTWEMDFFQMPPTYTADRIKRIIPHRNEVQPVYRERPTFTCYLKAL